MQLMQSLLSYFNPFLKNQNRKKIYPQYLMKVYCIVRFFQEITIFPLRKKASFSAASAQLRSCTKASEKLRKSLRYWHLRKSRLLRRAAEKPAFTKLLRNSAEKLQKSQLLRSFYAELRKNSHDEQKLRKRSNYAGANTAGFCEAF